MSTITITWAAIFTGISGRCSQVMNTASSASSMSSVTTRPPKKEPIWRRNSPAERVGARNTHVRLVKKAKSTAITQEMTLAISSLSPKGRRKSQNAAMLITVVNPPKKR